MGDKAIFKSLLNSLCIIEQVAQTQNEIGEIVKTWSTKYSNVKCRVQKKTARDNFSGLYGQAGATGLGEYVRADYTIYCESSLSITNADRVNFNGRLFQIVEAAHDSSLNHYQLDCKVLES